MKKQLLLFMMILLPKVANADAVEINGIYYNLVTKGNIAEVTRNPSKYTGSITIPETVTYNDVNYSVTSIGNAAFYNCSSLNSVSIPSSVTSIGVDAFGRCSSLQSVPIPNSVTSIGDYAFEYCTGLTSITIPNSVTSIGNMAFDGCSNLTTVNITDLEAWCKILFGNSRSNPLYYAKHLYIGGEEVKDLVIPNSVTSIGNAAFYNCSSLNSVFIPSSVTSIGGGAFSYCSGFSTITIPNSVTSIDNASFSGCSSLTTVIIGSGIKAIGQNTFASCPNLADFYCHAEKVPNISDDAFNNSYIEYATLHVPASAVDAYKAATPWSNFKEIIALTNDDPQPTGIDKIVVTDNSKDVFYDLNGRRVDNPSKGLYIKNGKKYVVK